MATAEEMYQYQYVTIIVDEFEKAALKSGTREGAMVFAMPAIAACRQILDSGEETIIKSSGTASQNRPVGDGNSGLSGSGSTVGFSAEGTTTPGVVTAIADASCVFPDLVDPNQDFQGLEVTPPGASVDASLDFSELIADLLGDEKSDITEDMVKEWLDECQPCDLRLNFAWQFQPTNLLEPFNQMFDQIEQMIDQFSERIDPFKSLQGLCTLLDALKGACLPDLIMILMSLKMLIGKYTSFGLDIKLDWTTILGPLLKLILDAVLALFQAIMQIMTAPIDCSIAMLEGINELINEGAELAGAVYGVGKAISDTAQKEGTTLPGIGTDWSFEQSPEIGYEPGDVRLAQEVDESATFASVSEDLDTLLPKPDAFSNNPGARGFGQQGPGPGGNSGSSGTKIKTGGKISGSDSFDDYLNNPDFKDIDALQQVILALREAKGYIEGLFSNLQYGVQSLNAFVTGGLKFQFSAAGGLIAVLDLISMITMIIRMSRDHGKDVNDWCKFLEENPQVLQEQLAITYPNADVTVVNKDIHLTQGSRNGTITVVGQCVNGRDAKTSSMLKNWISDLERGM
jgi:hypothetical protein